MDHILLETSPDGTIATLTLNRPAVRNAFNSTTITERAQIFGWVKAETGNVSKRASPPTVNLCAMCLGTIFENRDSV